MPGWAGTAEGIAWLGSRSSPDGSLTTTDDVATATQSTAESLRALVLLESGADPASMAARDFLLGADTDALSTEYLSRQIIALAETGLDSSEWGSQLLSRQNVDGGFGFAVGYYSSVLDTAFALESLAAAGYTHTEAAAYAVGYLQNVQRDDGGWGESLFIKWQISTPLFARTVSLSNGGLPTNNSNNSTPSE